MRSQLSKQRYGLVWLDVPEEFEKESEDRIPILEEVPEKEIRTDDGKPCHILIEGENYHALTCLNYTHRGKVDVIYIDPPYNTGSDGFRYRDKRFSTEFPNGVPVPKDSPFRHSYWLSFMAKRLELAKNLLSDRGVIFISIDDNEQANLKLLCDRIFGEENFRNQIFVRRRTKTLNLQFAEKGLHSFNIGGEYILVYANSQFLFKELRVTKEEKPSKGKWNVFWSNADRPTMRYELLGFTPETGQWRWSKEKAEEAVKNYEIYLEKYHTISLEDYWLQTGCNLKFIRRIKDGNGKNGGVQYWVGPSATFLRTSNWIDIEVSQIHKEINVSFENPKNTDLIIEILKSPFFEKNSSIILDFFAGSGTTLHAVMKLNEEDGGNRQCILVQLDENGICENVTYERNRRVMQGYENPKGEQVPGLGNSLKYYRTAFVGKNPPARALDADRIELACKAGYLLAMGENTLFEQTRTETFQIFADSAEKKRVTAIYFEMDIEGLDEFERQVKEYARTAEKVSAYLFSWSNGEEFESMFEEMPNIEVKSIPQPILEIYRTIQK